MTFFLILKVSHKRSFRNTIPVGQGYINIISELKKCVCFNTAWCSYLQCSIQVKIDQVLEKIPNFTEKKKKNFNMSCVNALNMFVNHKTKKYFKNNIFNIKINTF